MVVVGAVDADGRVWASLLTGEPGFVRALDERTVRIDAAPYPGDPLAKVLQGPGSAVGMISIDLATRRRVRLNGEAEKRPDGIHMRTRQVYANCPKYIQARVPVAGGAEPGSAQHAASLVRVEYEEERAKLSFDDAMKHEAVAPADVVGEEPRVEIGDAESALKDAEVKVENIYRTPRHNHNAMEPHAAVAAWDKKGNLTLYDSTQYVYGPKETLAKIFSVEPEKIRVVAKYVGGSFGGTGNVWNNTILCATVAKVAGRPVQLALSRRGVFHVVGGRSLTEQRVGIGANRDGKITALVHSGVNATTTHGTWADPFGDPARRLYATKNLLTDHKIVHLDTVANTAMRGPGPSVGTFALESTMDELAHELGMDPIGLRRINEPDRDPSTGQRFSSRHTLALRVDPQGASWVRSVPRARTAPADARP